MISELWIPLAGIAMIPTTVIGSIVAVSWARRAKAEAAATRLPSDLTMRLERMEQGIDSIAVEVERISEAQRFTSKLLAGRTESAELQQSTPGRQDR